MILQKRLGYLDAIRGLSALFVLVYHVICSHWAWMRIGQWGVFFFNGSDAVALFFVLSGLVLSYRFFLNNEVIDENSYKSFVIVRLFRLYPAFIVCLIFYYYAAHQAEPFSDLVWNTFTQNPYYFWEEALLIRDHHTLFLPDWTLGVEVAFSIFVPFLILLIRYNEKLFLYFTLALLFIGKLYVSDFLLAFCYGIWISKNYTWIENYNNPQKWYFKYRWYLFPFFYALFGIRHLIQLYPINSSVKYFFDSVLFINEFHFSCFAAAILLLYAINSKKIQHLLQYKVFMFLGKISYGIYLSHWFFCSFFIQKIDNFKSNFAQNNETYFFCLYLLGTLIGSIIVGLFLHYFVEVPFLNWGKKIALKYHRNTPTNQLN